MPYTRPITIPTEDEIKNNEKKYLPCVVPMDLMLPDSLDLTDEIYTGLLHIIKKPNDISVARFKKTLFIKAKIFNLFISDKFLIDKLLDDLEKECALNLLSSSIAQENLFKQKLCPNHYKEFVSSYTTPEDDEIEEHYYYPVISAEILNIQYPDSILAQAINQQLQKHDVNIAVSKKTVNTFIKTNSWLTFFGIVPVEKALKVLKKGMIFLDDPDYADGDVRYHGAYSHAVYEYLASKLLEGGYLGPLDVKGEPDLNERELVQADAWLIKKSGVKGITCLFDIMRERRPNKMKLLDVYPDAVYGFTSPDFLNQYLMLSSARFPSLSTLLYNQYALGTLEYFKLMPGFDALSQEQQLNIMNIHTDHKTFANDLNAFIKKNPNKYINYQTTSNDSKIMSRRAQQPLFKFPHTLDDSESYIRARKKTEFFSTYSTKKLRMAEVLLIEGPDCSKAIKKY